MEWTIQFSRQVLKDTKKLRAANLEANVRNLLNILRQNPYDPPMKNYQVIFRDITQDESISNIA